MRFKAKQNCSSPGDNTSPPAQPNPNAENQCTNANEQVGQNGVPLSETSLGNVVDYLGCYHANSHHLARNMGLHLPVTYPVYFYLSPSAILLRNVARMKATKHKGLAPA